MRVRWWVQWKIGQGEGEMLGLMEDKTGGG